MTLSSSPPQDEFISDAFEGAHGNCGSCLVLSRRVSLSCLHFLPSLSFPCLASSYFVLPFLALPCLSLPFLVFSFNPDDFATHHVELSKEDLEQIGVDRLSDKSENKKTSAPVSNNEASTTSEDKQKTPETGKGDIPDWERELQEELQVDGNSGLLSKSLSLTLKCLHWFAP